MDFNTALKIAKNPESSLEQLEELSNEVDEWNLDEEDNQIIFRLVAKHPKSSSGLLEILADRDDWETRRNVVLNPNTSKNILIELAPKFATSFYRNPAFDWLLLEDPDLLFKLGDGFFKDILKRDDCPESFMKWAENSENEQELFSLVMNPKTPRSILSRLAEKNSWIGIVAKAIVLGKPQLLANIRECKGEKFLHGFAEEHDDKIVEINIGRKIVNNILIDPGCPIEFMNWIILNGDECELLALASNNSTPVDILRKMLDSDNYYVRNAVALHTKIYDPLKSIHPTKIFEKAVKDALFDLGISTATDAWKHGWLDSGQWLWLNPDSRLYVLGLAEEDFSEEYWRSQFPALVDQFTKLRRYRPWTGNSLAVKELNELSATEKIRLLKAKTAIQRKEIASCPNASVELLNIFSRDRSADILSAVARNENSPPHVLSKLVGSRFPAVRMSLALNPSTPKSLLDFLSTDENIDVQKYVALSLESSDLYIRIWASDAVEKLIKISEKYKKTDKNELVLKLREIQKDNLCADFLKNQAVIQETDPEKSIFAKLIDANSSDLFVISKLVNWKMRDVKGLRLLAFRDSSLDVGIIFANYKSNDWLDRLAIACNPSCPNNILALLGKDTNRAVAQMAREVVLSKNKNKGLKKIQETFADGFSSASSDEFSVPSVQCPNCKGIIKEESGKYICCGVDGAACGCGFSFARTQSGRTFTPAEVDLLLRDHKTGLLRGFVSKAGKPFNAEMVIRFDEFKKTCRLVFDFVKDKKTEPALKLLSQDPDVDVMAAAEMSLLPHPNVPIVPAELAALVAPCPTCKGFVKEGIEGYSCVGSHDGQEDQGCGFAFKKTHAGRTFTVVEAEQLVRDGRIGPLTGFISKAGAPFTAQMCFMFINSSQNYRLQFDFGNVSNSVQADAAIDFSKQTSLGQCPKCSGDVYEQEKDYVCANSVASPANLNPSCDFKTGRNVLQQPISQDQVCKLLATGRTDLLDGFVSSRTQKRFTAMLVWDATAGRVNFEF